MTRRETIHIKVSKGLDLPMGRVPDPTLSEGKVTARVALLGRDYPQVRFDYLVDIGSRLAVGQPVLRDRHRPEIVVTSPVSGAVSAINLGARRSLTSLCIDTDEGHGDCVAALELPSSANRENIRRLMLESGLWPVLRSRPFDIIPAPDSEPRALFVTAIDTNPLSPDPASVIARHQQNFSAGLDALAVMVDSPLYLCQRPAAEIPKGSADRVVVATFEGPHPAGLPGTHIQALCPIGLNPTQVWHINYQDVISLGHLMNHGVPWNQREVSIAGPAMKQPRMMPVTLGSDLVELLEGELDAGPVRIVSGSVWSGDTAGGASAFLGRRHNQVTALPEPEERNNGRGKTHVLNTGLNGRAGAFVPTPALESVAPDGILPVPLLRALLVGDVERARALGALELAEEDIALLSYVCLSKTDYGVLLREALNALLREAA